MMGVNHARGIGAMNYSLDFVGGTSTNVTFDKEYTLEEIDSQMIPSLEEITGEYSGSDSKRQQSGSLQDTDT